MHCDFGALSSVLWRPSLSVGIRPICWYSCWYRRKNTNTALKKYQHMKLNDTRIKGLKPGPKTYRAADGEGLFLEISVKGSKLWKMAYRFEGKQKLLSFGKYPTVTLSMAREKRLTAKRLLTEGIDPNVQKKAVKQEYKEKHEHTFAVIADELIKKKAREGRAEATLKKDRYYLSLAEPDLGNRPIKDITSREILDVLRKPEEKGNFETAKKLRTFIGGVFRYAISTTRADNDPTIALQGALTAVKTKHYAAITDWTKFGTLINAIWSYDGGAPSTRAALKLMAILYPRPGELRLARWSEFDLEAGVWEIPEERAKMRRPHKKPLPRLAIDILEELKAYSGQSKFAFKSDLSRGKAISENTLNQSLRRMGFSADEMTSHGFRASASTLLNESGKWNPDAIEAELAHIGADEVRRAYHRALYWDERIKMADWWAGEIGQLINY